jgi:hypothetical protein
MVICKDAGTYIDCRNRVWASAVVPSPTLRAVENKATIPDRVGGQGLLRPWFLPANGS